MTVNLKDRPVFLLAPLSDDGVLHGGRIAALCGNPIAAIDDFSNLEQIHGLERWTGARFRDEIAKHPDALAIDFSISPGGKRWSAGLCEGVAERIDFSSLGAEIQALALSPAELRHAWESLLQEHGHLYLRLRAFGEGPPFVPNGHFYSPIAPKSEILKDDARIFRDKADVLGIDLNEQRQLETLASIKACYADLPFGADKRDGLRYFYENPAYSYSDAIFLNGMMRLARPKKYIEIGSGYSSCMALDTSELYFGDAVAFTFIEPYPQLLYSLLKPGDEARIGVIPSRVQDVDLALFDQLGDGDILFVDSTHVSRVGSDVNFIIFEILPRLASGVYIHFHDVFYPFEYPKEWILEGRAWNELYLLRAFLANNSSYEIVMFNTFLEAAHEPYFKENMPLCLKNKGGSLWLRKK